MSAQRLFLKGSWQLSSYVGCLTQIPSCFFQRQVEILPVCAFLPIAFLRTGPDPSMLCTKLIKTYAARNRTGQYHRLATILGSA